MSLSHRGHESQRCPSLSHTRPAHRFIRAVGHGSKAVAASLGGKRTIAFRSDQGFLDSLPANVDRDCARCGILFSVVATIYVLMMTADTGQWFWWIFMSAVAAVSSWRLI